MHPLHFTAQCKYSSASPMKFHSWLPPRGATGLLRSLPWRRFHNTRDLLEPV